MLIVEMKLLLATNTVKDLFVHSDLKLYAFYADQVCQQEQNKTELNLTK